MSSLFAVSLFVAAQSAPALNTSTPDTDWTVVSGVAVQAGDEVVSMGELEEIVQYEAARTAIPVTDRERYAELVRSIVREVVAARLEPQAGRDLGLDPAQIEYFVQSNIASSRKRLGSANFADRFLSDGRTLDRLVESQEAGTYRDLWRANVLGGDGLPGSRAIVDTYIRPGELAAIYDSSRTMLDPDQVELQLLWARTEAYGGETLARESLEEVKRRAEDGEDFDLLVEEFATADVETLGFQPTIPVPMIADPALRAFADEASVGDIGPILEVSRGGSPYLVIPRVNAKDDRRVPEYGERGVQTELRERFTAERKRSLLERERLELLRGEFAWFAPQLQGLALGPEGQSAP